MTHLELREKVQAFIKELKDEGVKFAIFIKNDNRCDITVECTNKDFADMIEELCSRVENPFATDLGWDFTSMGIALLKVHNEKEYLRIKEKIANI